MTVKLKEVDAVVIGMGWAGAILARELTLAGLSNVAPIAVRQRISRFPAFVMS
jgi:choline dehydrogenase-like flavoprotein